MKVKRNVLLVLLMMAILFSACGTDGNESGNSIDDAGNIEIESTSEPPSDYRAQTEALTPERDNIIQAVVSKNCNYVYHMLAVSNCGYNNEYGSTYKPLHAEENLQTLKNHELLLTVIGGEHQGDLYFLCVVLPASLDDEISVKLYFEALADLFTTGDIEQNYETYLDIYEQSFSSVTDVSLESFREFYRGNERLKTELAEITAVMRDNYDVYSDEVWETSFAELTVVAEALNKEFAENNYVSKWEEVLDHQYRQESFYALMCNSMEGGVDAINITDDKDVFCHTGECASTAQYISHEFGIFQLMDVLADTDAFQDYIYYSLVEGLAEYYNKDVSGGYADWNAGVEYIDFYEQLQESEPGISPEEMFLRAIDYYVPYSRE